MTSASFTPKGPFSLAASIRFLEGFTPASYDQGADGVLRTAFPADDGVHVIGCAVRQKETAGPTPATVTADITVHHGDTTLPADAGTDHYKAARAQLARILSLDVDGAGFPDVFPAAEPRVHRAMATEYGLDAAAGDPARLARIATAWSPYRSWVALLLRARAQDSARR